MRVLSIHELWIGNDLTPAEINPFLETGVHLELQSIQGYNQTHLYSSEVLQPPAERIEEWLRGRLGPPTHSGFIEVENVPEECHLMIYKQGERWAMLVSAP